MYGGQTIPLSHTGGQKQGSLSTSTMTMSTLTHLLTCFLALILDISQIVCIKMTAWSELARIIGNTTREMLSNRKKSTESFPPA